MATSVAVVVAVAAVVPALVSVAWCVWEGEPIMNMVAAMATAINGGIMLAVGAIVQASAQGLC